MSIRLLTALVLSVCGCMTASQAQTPKPSVWISPPGQDKCLAFRQLFEQPDAWKETRARTDVLFITDLNLQRHFTDD
jgi:hypothetical protein